MTVTELIDYLKDLDPQTTVVWWSYEDGGSLVEADLDRFEFVDATDKGPTLILPHVK